MCLKKVSVTQLHAFGIASDWCMTKVLNKFQQWNQMVTTSLRCTSIGDTTAGTIRQVREYSRKLWWGMFNFI
jgi:hypothetical protein